MVTILSNLRGQLAVLSMIHGLFIFLGADALGDQAMALDHPTTMAKLRDQISETLRLEATAKSSTDQEQALVDLCDWYVLIRAHREFDDFPLMQAQATKIRNRLLRSRRKLASRLKRTGTTRPEGLSDEVESRIAQLLASRAEKGEPTGMRGAPAGGGLDTGWELVELITRTIDPGAWRSNGGEATLHYFAIKRVLVVSATTEIHEDLEALLDALR